MDEINNILVILQGSEDVELALVRATELAQATGAGLTLYIRAHEQLEGMTALDRDKTATLIREQITARQTAYLDTLSRPLHQQSITVQYAIDWEPQPIVGIIEVVRRFGIDFVVKESRHHSKIKTLFYTPTDWHLLRKCPVPLWLLHQQISDQPQRILAAVSSVFIDDEYQRLDQRVLKYATGLATRLGCDLQVVNAYCIVPLGVSLDGAGIYQDEYLQDLQQQHHQRTLELTRTFAIPDANVETRNGEAQTVIAQAAVELKVDLVVLGTVARHGIAGVFIGNTAEQILEMLDCEVLTLKQENFSFP